MQRETGPKNNSTRLIVLFKNIRFIYVHIATSLPADSECEIATAGVIMTGGNLGIAEFGADLRSAADLLWRKAGRAAAMICCWMEVARQRRQLSMLDDRALKDFGINRSQAEHETARPFWDLPCGLAIPAPRQRR